jgi:CheY-like chemotaxis protein
MSYKILIIDDEESEFKKYQQALRIYSELELYYAHHGPEAICCIQNQSIDLIFLDQVFYLKNIGVVNSYWESEGNLVLHEEDDTPRYIQEHENLQGLYVLKAIRTQGYKGPIILLTAHLDKEGSVWKLIKASATDYTSKGEFDDNRLTQLIEKYLHIRLRSLKKEIEYLIDNLNVHFEDKGLICNILLDEAKQLRRLAIPFINEVIKKLPPNPTIRDLENKIIEVKAQWQYEEINNKELLIIALDNWPASLQLPSIDHWDFEGFDGLRFSYKSKQKDHCLYLRIIHPRFASDSPSVPELQHKPAFFDILKIQTFPLRLDDPYWEGGCIIAYLEKGNDAQPLKKYCKNCSLENLKAKEILQTIKNIITEPDFKGHGCITIDSIYIRAKNQNVGHKKKRQNGV